MRIPISSFSRELYFFYLVAQEIEFLSWRHGGLGPRKGWKRLARDSRVFCCCEYGCGERPPARGPLDSLRIIVSLAAVTQGRSASRTGCHSSYLSPPPTGLAYGRTLSQYQVTEPKKWRGFPNHRRGGIFVVVD